MNKTLVDLDNNLMLRSENIEYDGDSLKNELDTIIESGSNKHGTWIKLPKGILICTGLIDDVTVSNNTIKDVTMEFPLHFTKVDSVLVSSLSASIAYQIGSLHVSAPSTLITNSNFIIRFFNNGCGDRIPGASYIAIGKWK